MAIIGGAERIKDFNCFNDNKGISLVFLNTIKGEVFFNSIRKNIFYVQTSLDKCLQPNLKSPTKIHPLRSVFENDYKNKSFNFVFDKYFIFSRKSKLKFLLKSLILGVFRYIKNI